MDNSEKFISHYGVPGMKWGKRIGGRYDAKAARSLAKADKLDAKGKTNAANNKRESAAIYKQRGKNAKEIGRIGEKIRKGTSTVDKLLNTDVNLMSMKLSKGKYTRSELVVSNIIGGSAQTMRALVNQQIISG